CWAAWRGGVYVWVERWACGGGGRVCGCRGGRGGDEQCGGRRRVEGGRRFRSCDGGGAGGHRCDGRGVRSPVVPGQSDVGYQQDRLVRGCGDNGVTGLGGVV